MGPDDALAYFETARKDHDAADASRRQLGKVLLRTMRALMPPGTLLELNRRPVAEHLLRVRTMSGNDRKTRTFRVVQVVSIDVDALRPELSTWVCEAVPVSEKTGKDMSAATHASSRDTVRLHGDVGFMGMDEPAEAARDRLIKLVTQHS
ncbi:hypothetical protein WJ96_05865 [Burkholderia ubonensis]|uniref:Uncharacterized protein n=1 Tax=Burkholderia ubonensis TaxID=101571 RepID=A0AAW3MWD2_9BURK|nr:hypothetical protein [Burkholderia ubonensis]KVP75282.1 hypothetical protein WJ93_07660 [Burkholderia ubonensis]KVP98095.1 hypothetical protein WJ96_05865 [Burkholderia ubonensis]KVZ92792.1 hypothetical protein WL25_17525 [Burkholderia ubonensis]